MGSCGPQLASLWSTLSETERLDGAEAILAASKGGKTVLVIGVQAPDMAAVMRYAEHARRTAPQRGPSGAARVRQPLRFVRHPSRGHQVVLSQSAHRRLRIERVAQFQEVPTVPLRQKQRSKDTVGNAARERSRPSEPDVGHIVCTKQRL
jgi:hypothetical protein